MRNEVAARHKVVWSFAIVVRHVRWYITTSETISQLQKEQMLESLLTLLRQVQSTERIERRLRPSNTYQVSNWKDPLNAIRIQYGKRPVGKRRLVNELIARILKQ